MNEELLQMIAENMAKQTELLDALVKKEAPGDGEEADDLHTKTPANSMTAQRLHGSGGLFAIDGLERDIITAHVRPYGLASKLPLFPSVNEDPRYGALTGVSDDIGNEPTNVCEDAPTGYIKAATLTARFGFIRRDTSTVDISEVTLRKHRGDFTDLVLRGRMLGLTNLTPSGLNEGQMLDLITMSEMVNVAVRTERKLNKQIWQGSRAIAGEFAGLDDQIATGQVDAETNVLVPSLDSDVKNYNYQVLDTKIVEYLSMLEWYLRYNAMTMGLDPVNWVIVMRPELWQELTAVWPIAYNTTKGSVAGPNSTIFIDGRVNVSERDAMRNGMYIDINGNRYNVVTDVGIYEQNNVNDANLLAGQYASSIYMVPLTITGNFPATYREYVDFRGAQPEASILRGMQDFFWTDQGVYSWAIEQAKWCFKLALLTRQRVILRTPHLAGRIDNVKYEPLQHIRESDPTSPYWADGGVSLGTAIGNPNAVWQP